MELIRLYRLNLVLCREKSAAISMWNKFMGRGMVGTLVRNGECESVESKPRIHAGSENRTLDLLELEHTRGSGSLFAKPPAVRPPHRTPIAANSHKCTKKLTKTPMIHNILGMALPALRTRCEPVDRIPCNALSSEPLWER